EPRRAFFENFGQNYNWYRSWKVVGPSENDRNRPNLIRPPSHYRECQDMSVEERPDKRVPARMNGGKVKVSMSHKYRSFHTEDTSNFHSPRAPLASQSTSSFTVCQVKSGGATTTRSLGSPSFPGPYRNVPCPPPRGELRGCHSLAFHSGRTTNQRAGRHLLPSSQTCLLTHVSATSGATPGP
ncbi:hypothetical protein CDAR_502311, partial [Caerostris darwini]